jgi:plasmid stabilization system protein ParE
MASYGFHPEAAEEYLGATQYYLDHASPLVAAAFVAEVEAGIQTLLASPTRWGRNRRAADTSLPAHAISLLNLLSLGTGT